MFGEESPDRDSPDGRGGNDFDDKKMISLIDRELERCADDLEAPGLDRKVGSLADLKRNQSAYERDDEML